LLVCYNVYRTRAQVHRALWTMIAVGAAISVLGIVQRVTWNGRFYWIGPEAPHRNAFGPFVNRAHFAGLMVVVVPMALALWLTSRYTPTRKQLVRTLRDRLRSWNTADGGPTTLIPFLVLLMGGAALVSGTRGGLVALMVVLLAMIAAGMRERTGAAARIAAYGALVVLAGLWIGSDVVQGTLERLVEELEQGTESSRLVIWSDALGVWRHAPTLGTGLATFEAVFPSVRTIMAPVVFTHAESDWVQLLTDTGLVGLLAVLATLGVIVVSCLRLRTRTRLDILAIGAAVAALGAASQGVGNFSFVVLSNLLYVAAAVGVVCPYLRGKAADHA
jgi:O-antigen ligase